MKTIFAVSSFCLVGEFGFAQAPLSMAVAGGYGKTLIVPKERFTEAELLRMSKTLLEGPKYQFRDVWFFTSESDALSLRSSKFAVHVPYFVWQSAYLEVPKDMLVAELISIGSSAILRMRESGQQIRRFVLAGNDPLTIDIFGKRFHLLHFAASAVRTGSKEQRLEVFAFTEVPLGHEIGLSVLREITALVPFTLVFLHLRSDPWFISATGYPLFPPFNPEFPVPEREQYVNSSTLVCGNRTDGKSSCALISRQE